MSEIQCKKFVELTENFKNIIKFIKVKVKEKFYTAFG